MIRNDPETIRSWSGCDLDMAFGVIGSTTTLLCSYWHVPVCGDSVSKAGAIMLLLPTHHKKNLCGSIFTVIIFTQAIDVRKECAIYAIVNWAYHCWAARFEPQ